MTNPKVFPDAKLPDWVFTIAKDSCLNAKELTKIYCVSKSTFLRWVRDGIFPAPDFSHKGFNSMNSTKPTQEWRVSTVIKFARTYENH